MKNCLVRGIVQRSWVRQKLIELCRDLVDEQTGSKRGVIQELKEADEEPLDVDQGGKGLEDQCGAIDGVCAHKDGVLEVGCIQGVALLAEAVGEDDVQGSGPQRLE